MAPCRDLFPQGWGVFIPWQVSHFLSSHVFHAKREQRSARFFSVVVSAQTSQDDKQVLAECAVPCSKLGHCWSMARGLGANSAWGMTNYREEPFRSHALKSTDSREVLPGLWQRLDSQQLSALRKPVKYKAASHARALLSHKDVTASKHLSKVKLRWKCLNIKLFFRNSCQDVSGLNSPPCVLCCLPPWCIYAQSRTAARPISSSPPALLGSHSGNQCGASNTDWPALPDCPGSCCQPSHSRSPFPLPREAETCEIPSCCGSSHHPLYKRETTCKDQEFYQAFLPTRNAQRWIQAKHKLLGWLLQVIGQ